MSELLFRGFYARSIHSFVIPEFIISDKLVRRNFRSGNLYNKLVEGKDLHDLLGKSNKLHPIFDFTRKTKSGYTEEFWGSFWGDRRQSKVEHFPFETTLKGDFSRVFEKQSSYFHVDKTRNNFPHYTKHGKVKIRLFPYGAVSIHIIEYIKSATGISAKEIVETLQRPIIWNHRTFTVKQFIDELRHNILKKILRKNHNYTLQTTSPQYYIINPEVQNLPDLDIHWKEIARMLAMSSKENHIEKFQKATYGHNYGMKDQFLTIGPYSSVLFNPVSINEQNFHRIRCLRNRISNISELIVMQESFITKLQKTFESELKNIRTKQHHTLLIRLLKYIDYFEWDVEQKIEDSNVILTLQNDIRARARWSKWYWAIAKEKQHSFEEFLMVLKSIHDTKFELGESVRGDLETLADRVYQYLSLLKLVQN